MKLGELFIQLGVKGDTKKLDKAIKQLEEAEKKTKMLIQYRRDLAKATTEEERKLVKRNFADNIRLLNLNEQQAAMLGLANTATVVATAVIGAVVALDRMADSMAKINQKMINFQRQTGLSFVALNKYTSANAAVNYNATEEGMAHPMQTLSNNLREIKLGRGDISPYQELAYVGGKPINVWGKSVEQVIEEVREAIKGVDDVSATNIITRMGFSPEDLLMLRMTKKEFDEISNSYFLSPEQREEMYKYSLELKKIHLQIQYMYQNVVLFLTKYLIPQLKPIFEGLNHICKALEKINELKDRIFHKNDTFSKVTEDIKAMGEAIGIALNPFLSLFYILEDIAVYFLGGKSIMGIAVEGLQKWGDTLKDNLKSLTNLNFGNFDLSRVINQLKTEETAIPNHISYGGNTNNNAVINNNLDIHTSQSVSELLTDATQYGFAQVQMQPIG